MVATQRVNVRQPKDLVYTIAEAAQLLKVSRRTVERELERGNLKYVRVSVARRITGESISAYLRDPKREKASNTKATS